MSRLQPVLLFLVAALLALPLAGCSGQSTETPEIAGQTPPPPPPPSEAAPPPPVEPQRQAAPEPPSRPQRIPARPAQTIPEERPRPAVPQAPPEPATVSIDIPQGTSLSLELSQTLSSASAAVGTPVSARLKSPVIVGDRVIFPAGSSVEGRVVDVKPAKKGFKDTGGAIAVAFDRIAAPDGHRAVIAAGFSKVAEGSGKKKGAIIGGSAVGGALLGRVLGKDAKGAALLGGAIGTAVAGSTKGREATIGPEDQITVALERPTSTTMKR